ncbi:predicted protein [Plenodomus lingam JN3]|uniref:Predicted protein n=1 Tax=Leptosphaeria maculans (strain JN3 / isolate v23.1.3 / race Av1-4-5-6-7-8) TaxID=985895 RepID=E4ZI20_LEPMJ|nr:predicted protein [Plenodomus lingam JN3]CBX91163.1 predicted protein [Plenodomus lingam JN3]
MARFLVACSLASEPWVAQTSTSRSLLLLALAQSTALLFPSNCPGP